MNEQSKLTKVIEIPCGNEMWEQGFDYIVENDKGERYPVTRRELIELLETIELENKKRN